MPQSIDQAISGNQIGSTGPEQGRFFSFLFSRGTVEVKQEQAIIARVLAQALTGYNVVHTPGIVNAQTDCSLVSTAQ